MNGMLNKTNKHDYYCIISNTQIKGWLQCVNTGIHPDTKSEERYPGML